MAVKALPAIFSGRISSPFTIHPTEASADAVAAVLTQGEVDGWTYRVVPNDSGYVVAIHDEDGLFVRCF